MAAKDARAGDDAAGRSGWAPYVVVALLIWLGWQVVVGLLVQRAPPEVAVRVAPGSALALSRAAEGEYVAGRVDQARDLAILSLRAAPFDVRALRVLGQTLATTDADKADELLTLAGNWSLRDDPSHAWLIERRLRRGDYVGAFGHADVLARRREDLRPVFFRLFATAAALDPRAGPALLQRMAARPVWRTDFLDYLRTFPDGPKVQALLALGLNEGEGRLADFELEVIYLDWLKAGRLPGLLELRRRTGRPPAGTVVDGGFDGTPGPQPFGWFLPASPGVTAAFSEDASREGEHALFIQSDGFLAVDVARQLVALKPGAATLSYSTWVESGETDPRLRWTLTCVESGARVVQSVVPPSPQWTARRVTFTVPPSNCTAQWLALEGTQGARRTSISTWVDDVAISSGVAR